MSAHKVGRQRVKAKQLFNLTDSNIMLKNKAAKGLGLAGEVC